MASIETNAATAVEGNRVAIRPNGVSKGRIAILNADQVENTEFFYPYDRFWEEGYDVDVNRERDNDVRTTQLGDGLTVSAQGFGAMGISSFYGSTDEIEAVATLRRAVDLGITFIDTAEAYGPFANEKFIGRALSHRRDDLVIATKFGTEYDDEGRPHGANGTPAYARLAVERSLRHLGTDRIELLYLHRVDPNTPIEETVEGMAALVRDGLVRHIGLCEVSASTLRRAQVVHPIAAVQSEFSLFSRDILVNGVADAAAELGVGLVAFSPLGRGFLTGKITTVDDLEPGDARRGLPRFQPEAIATNLAIVEQMKTLAAELDATPAQVALAWVKAHGVVPIPGTRKQTRLEENAAADTLVLSDQQLAKVTQAIKNSPIAGDRDTPAGLSRMNI